MATLSKYIFTKQWIFPSILYINTKALHLVAKGLVLVSRVPFTAAHHQLFGLL